MLDGADPLLKSLTHAKENEEILPSAVHGWPERWGALTSAPRPAPPCEISAPPLREISASRPAPLREAPPTPRPCAKSAPRVPRPRAAPASPVRRDPWITRLTCVAQAKSEDWAGMLENLIQAQRAAQVQRSTRCACAHTRATRARIRAQRLH